MMKSTIPASIALDSPLNKTDWLCIAALYLYSIRLLVPSLKTVCLWIVMPICFILCLIKNRRALTTHLFVTFFLLYLWITLLYPEAAHTESAYNHIIRCWGTFIICFISYNMGLKRRTFNLACGSYVLIFLVIIWYIQNNMSELINLATIGKKVRLQDDNLNANTMAYYLIIITSAIYYFGETFHGWWRTFWRLSLILLIPMSFYISILTSSRQILILGVPFLVILVYKRYVKLNLKNALITIVTVLSLTVTYYSLGLDLYNQSFLRERMSKQITKDSRAQLVRESIDIFKENPITGIGPNEFMFHSKEGVGAHNSYLELLADTGIIGFILFALIIFNFVKKQYHRWYNSKSSVYYGFLIYAIIFAIENNFYIFYIAPPMIAFFTLNVAYSDSLWATLTGRKLSPEAIAVAKKTGILNP